MGRGGSAQIAVVDAGKISLAREDKPEAKDFAEVAKYNELLMRVWFSVGFLHCFKKVSKELCSAFQDTGFAYLVNHGIEQELVQQVDRSQLKHKLCGLGIEEEEEERYHSTQAMEKSLEFFSLDEGVKEQMSKGPEYQVKNENLR